MYTAADPAYDHRKVLHVMPKSSSLLRKRNKKRNHKNPTIKSNIIVPHIHQISAVAEKSIFTPLQTRTSVRFSNFKSCSLNK